MPGSEGRNHGTLVFGFDELLDFGGRQSGLELLDLGAAVVTRADGHDVGVGRILAFDGKGVLHRVETGAQGVVGVDDGERDIVKGARKLGGLDLLGLSTTSLIVAVTPASGRTLMRPAVSSTLRARPPLVGSFGMATSEPSATSATFFTLWEYTPIGSM